MKYIKLDLSHDNFYCPATGTHIQSKDHFEPVSSSLKAYWISDVGLDEPAFDDAKLEEAWATLSAMLNENNEGIDWEDVEKFLDNYDQPNYVAYEITTGGIACGPVSSTVVFVIDMDTGK
ncbi:hypothetical protein N8697_00920 [bacterium]|nr:hypothetical protein [bacterium]